MQHRVGEERAGMCGVSTWRKGWFFGVRYYKKGWIIRRSAGRWLLLRRKRAMFLYGDRPSMLAYKACNNALMRRKRDGG